MAMRLFDCCEDNFKHLILDYYFVHLSALCYSLCILNMFERGTFDQHKYFLEQALSKSVPNSSLNEEMENKETIVLIQTMDFFIFFFNLEFKDL